ncbi:MAG: selenocysteine-specific translation elongation factor [Acidobacteria bacterium]|nr:selenocysteine-specific translation elongation factor [Acidobacteriota bacterium]
MKSVIVGTAGHIDHGKTALVKALTGIDADRLAEEKRRGITIDLGFAHLELRTPGGEAVRLGFVDVPGHERFVRNMLAGVGGIDIVLLVIAADEGVKPQTREHFAICRLLRLARGITVLTKADAVDPEMLEVARLEAQEFVAGSFLDAAHSPIVATSALTGAGLDTLKACLLEQAQAAASRSTRAIARLPIDRVFTMKGHGTVVTGTLIAGEICKESELEALPPGRRVRVRGVQVHNRAAEKAMAGERTAVNLAGVETTDLARGTMLALPGMVGVTRTADARLELLEGVRPLKNRSRVHLHCYAAETVAEVVLLEGSEMAGGKSCFARLRLASPIQLLPGDRFIIRQFSPVITIGGGEVLDALSPRAGTIRAAYGTEKRRQFLEAVSARGPEAALSARLGRRGFEGGTVAQLVAETGWTREQVTQVARSLANAGSARQAGDRLLTEQHWKRLRDSALEAVKRFHRNNRLAAGMNREELRGEIQSPPEVFEAVIESLLSGGQLEAAGEQIREAGHGVTMHDDESAARERIEKAFAAAGLKVPLLKEVMAGLPVDRVRAQKLLTLLLRERVLIKLGDELVFHSAALHELRAAVQRHKQQSPTLDVAAFKELTGVSRKYAIPLLEYLDRERITRRVGDARVIL